MRRYPHFTLTRGSSPGFGSMPADLRPLQTRFRFGSGLPDLNLARQHLSPVHSTKGTPSHELPPTLRLIVGTRFQVLFHSAPAVLFTFPSRYSFSIGRQGVFSLGRWSSQIPTGFLGPRGTWGLAHRVLTVSSTGLSPSPAGLPMPFPYSEDFSLCQAFAATCSQAPQPPHRNGCNLSHAVGLGSSAFARHYSRNHVCFLLLGVLRCFSSPGCPRMPIHSAYGTGPSRPVGSPIRTSTDLRSLTAPRGVSAFAPSFFGSWRLGIHRAPFLSSPVFLQVRSLSACQGT